MMAFTEFAVLIFSALLLGGITFWKRKSPARLRDIPALFQLHRILGVSIEDGTRLHVSLGYGNLLDMRGASALAALSMLRRIGERASVSDAPTVASAGDSMLGLLSQDTLQAGYKAASAADLYSHTTGRVAGVSPFGYAAAAMHISPDENVSANILIGHFGPEIALLTDAAERGSAIIIGASDNLAGQSVLFANTQNPLIGEELFAAGVYLGEGASHAASLTLQDIFRWVIILILLGGTVARLMGVI